MKFYWAWCFVSECTSVTHMPLTSLTSRMVKLYPSSSSIIAVPLRPQPLLWPRHNPKSQRTPTIFILSLKLPEVDEQKNDTTSDRSAVFATRRRRSAKPWAWIVTRNRIHVVTRTMGTNDKFSSIKTSLTAFFSFFHSLTWLNRYLFRMHCFDKWSSFHQRDCFFFFGTNELFLE